jgi:hypothetical protein
MAAYASQSDFEDYVEGWVTDDPGALADLLGRAALDVDRIFPALTVKANGLKYGDLTENPEGLTDQQIDALKRANCAQAEYRFHKGEEWFVEEQFASVSGPDFSTRGRQPRIGPKVREELEGLGFATTGWTHASV